MLFWETAGWLILCLPFPFTMGCSACRANDPDNRPPCTAKQLKPPAVNPVTKVVTRIPSISALNL